MSADIIEFGSKEIRHSPAIGTQDSYYTSLIKALMDSGILPSSYSEEDIELDEPEAGEEYLGTLTEFEKKLFIAYTIAQSVHVDSVSDRADYWLDRFKKEGAGILPNVPNGYFVSRTAVISLHSTDQFQFLSLFLNDGERKFEHRKLIALQSINMMYTFAINEHFGSYGRNTIERAGFTLYSY
jgi:hypothetical protein